MAELVAVRYPTLGSAEAGCYRLAAAVTRGYVSARAVAIVWVDRKSRHRVRQGLPPYIERSWSTWLALTAASLYGCPPDLIECHHGPLVPEPLDPSVAVDICRGLRRGEAAVVVKLAESTPLLLVEVLRLPGVGLLRTTLAKADEELVSALFREGHLA
jgi:hypothetical protein